MEKLIIVESEFFTEGLFGQVLAWLIETLPTLTDAQVKPSFLIRSKNYGDPQFDYNIIPHTIELNYVPEKSILPESLRPFLIREDDESYYLSLNEIKYTNGHPSFKNFKPDFDNVNHHFYRFFRIPHAIQSRVEALIHGHSQILGIHYRGTDKTDEPFQNPNPISDHDLFEVIDSFVHKHNIKTLYLATDTKHIVQTIKDRHTNLAVLTIEMNRYDSDIRIFEAENQDPILNSVNAMVDAFALSKCQKVIMTNSALSGFAKIFNPDLDIYRTCEFGFDWFPIHYIPYSTKTELLNL